MPTITSNNFSAYFNGFDLSSISDLRIYDYKSRELPSRDVKINKLARQNLSVITTAEFYQKEITISGMIRDCDTDDGAIALSELKARTAPLNGLLKIHQGGSELTWRATMSGLSLQIGGYWQKFTITFLCSDPIAKAEDETTWIDQVTTATPTVISNPIVGSFQMFPYILLTYTSVTGATGQDIIITNDSTGEVITITNTYANSDVVSIDCENKIVLLNGNRIDYTGKFPAWSSLENGFSYQDTFTTRDVTILVTYYARYL